MAPAQGDGKDPPGTPFLMVLFCTSRGLADLDELSLLREDNVTVCQKINEVMIFLLQEF